MQDHGLGLAAESGQVHLPPVCSLCTDWSYRWVLLLLSWPHQTSTEEGGHGGSGPGLWEDTPLFASGHLPPTGLLKIESALEVCEWDPLWLLSSPVGIDLWGPVTHQELLIMAPNWEWRLLRLKNKFGSYYVLLSANSRSIASKGITATKWRSRPARMDANACQTLDGHAADVHVQLSSLYRKAGKLYILLRVRLNLALTSTGNLGRH